MTNTGSDGNNKDGAGSAGGQNAKQPAGQKSGAQKSRRHAKGTQSDDSSFTSFSDGLAAIDKFQIVGQEVSAQGNLHPTVQSKTQSHEDDSFTSFSDGTPAVDRFTILDRDRKITSGDLILLSDFLKSTSCHHLKRALNEEKESGSESLDRLLHLCAALPWRSEILVEISPHPSSREYRFLEDTIVLDSTSSDDQMLLDFTHQCFHATNRLLSKIYEDSMLDRIKYLDLLLWAEVAALIMEINVRRDFQIKGCAPYMVLCKDNSGTLSNVDVERYLQENGIKALHDELAYSLIRGDLSHSLLELLDELYIDYAESYESRFDEAQKIIELCLSSGLERDCI